MLQNIQKKCLEMCPCGLDNVFLEYCIHNIKAVYELAASAWSWHEQVLKHRRSIETAIALATNSALTLIFFISPVFIIHQVLNEYFHNVCELDLVFNFYKVYSVVDEMFLAGEIRETSQTKVLKQLTNLSQLDWREGRG